MKVLVLSHAKGGVSDGWSRYTADLLSSLTREGADVHSVDATLHTPLTYLSRPWVPFLDLRAIREEMVRVNPDVIHVTVEPYTLLLPFLPLTGKTVVLTVHGTYSYLPATVPGHLRVLYEFWYRQALKKVTHIIAVSEFTKSYFLRHVTESPPVTVIHNSIDLKDRLLPEKRPDRKTILTVAPVKARKGILEAVRAVGAYVRTYGTDIEYRIVGSYNPEEPETKKVMREIETLGLERIVTFIGKVSEEALRAEYGRATVFLMLPRVREPYFEGFGLVYLEANAYGVPVIGSREGGPMEAIKDGVSGYLVSPEDAQEVAERLHAVLDEQGISPETAREWALAHDSGEMVRKVLAVYTA